MARLAALAVVTSEDAARLQQRLRLSNAEAGLLGATAVPETWLRGREFLLHKKHFDVFTNPNAELLLEHFKPDEIVLFGVATDICDDAAVRALLRRGRRIAFVEDASRGVDEARIAACTAAWREAGVRFATAEEAVASLG